VSEYLFNDKHKASMNFKRHKIFASGVHKNEAAPVWPPEKVIGVLAATKEYSPLKIPYTYRHPENSLPVLGYTDRSSVEMFEEHGRTYLTAQPADFAKEWIASLKKTGFDKVSIGLGKLGEIVHIGITDNPAVSGLGLAFEAADTVPPVFISEVEFESKDLSNLDEVFEVSWKWQLQSWMDDVSSLFQKLRDREIEMNGVDAADKFLPPYIIDFIKTPLLPEEDQANNGPVSVNPSFENDMSVEEKEELERLRAENALLLQKQVDAEALRVQGEIAAFCVDHAAVVTPRIKDTITAVLLDLHGALPRQFEVDGKKVEKTTFEALKELIAGAKPQLVFEDVATKAAAPDGTVIAGDSVFDVLKAQFEAVKAKG
jgi:hypothetical protein